MSSSFELFQAAKLEIGNRGELAYESPGNLRLSGFSGRIWQNFFPGRPPELLLSIPRNHG
jgi:hypothetical protein